MTNTVGHFSLWGDFEVDEITTALGMEPSWAERKGDILEGADSPARVATWDLHCPSDMSINEQIDYLLATLSPSADALQKLAYRFNAALNLTGTCENGAEVLTLKPETLQKLLSLNVTLNCFYGKDEFEDGD
jgi:hypothetical protein